MAPANPWATNCAMTRYLDEFVKQDGEWQFAERRLMVNWTETRPSTP
jgi:hypothetical protein